jgi:hypothetical protein
MNGRQFRFLSAIRSSAQNLLRSGDMPTNHHQSEGQLPAVHGAILELHLIIIRCMASVGLHNYDVARIRRATQRAAIAVEHAAGGHRRRYNLQRAHEAMITALALMRLLHLEEMIEGRPYHHVRRRIDQILLGLEQLTNTAPECWSAVELVPVDSESNDSDSSAEGSRLALLLARVAKAVRDILTLRPVVTRERPDAEVRASP